MITIRTDGSGSCYNNERLIRVSEILDSIPFNTPILKITDHKGKLSVLWDETPENEETDIVKGVWFLFNEYEIEHKTV